jgi:hypothetical protein
MKQTMAAWTAMAIILISANSLVAHHSLSEFDTTRPVLVRGTIVLFERVNPHTILFIDEKGEDGKIQRWAVDGPAVNQLDRMGLGKNALTIGGAVEACGYVTREGVEPRRTIHIEASVSLKATTPTTVSGRRMNGELLVLPDGQKRVWSDYGQHKCLGPDYRDSHVR